MKKRQRMKQKTAAVLAMIMALGAFTGGCGVSDGTGKTSEETETCPAETGTSMIQTGEDEIEDIESESSGDELTSRDATGESQMPEGSETFVSECSESETTGNASEMAENETVSQAEPVSYSPVEKAWLSILKNEIISLGESGEYWDGEVDREYHCAYGIYGGDGMKIVDADVRINMTGDRLNVNGTGYSGRRAVADFLMQEALCRAGELYLAQSGDLSEPVTISLYVTELEPEGELPTATIVIAAGEADPVEMVVVGTRKNYFGTFTHSESTESAFVGESEALNSVITARISLSISETSLWQHIDRGELAVDRETEPERLSYGVFQEGKKNYYTGSTVYPIVDYDGDGATDRVFKSEKSNVYLLLSSGDIIYLAQQESPDQGGWLECVDMNGDGTPETVYVRYHWSSGGEPHYIQMWERTENGLESIPFVYVSGESVPGSTQIGIPLILEKIDGGYMKITQPECGITVTQKFVEDEFDHWGFKDGQKGPIDSVVFSDSITILTDPESGEAKLRMFGGVGDKWSSIYVVWEMTYEDGAWKVSAFSNK